MASQWNFAVGRFSPRISCSAGRRRRRNYGWIIDQFAGCGPGSGRIRFLSWIEVDGAGNGRTTGKRGPCRGNREEKLTASKLCQTARMVKMETQAIIWGFFALCLLLSFVLSGMEAGVFALSRLRIRQQMRAGKRSAQ